MEEFYFLYSARSASAPRRESFLLLRIAEERCLIISIIQTIICVVTDNCDINDINLSIFHTRVQHNLVHGLQGGGGGGVPH